MKNRKKIAVTGSSGFIGRFVADEVRRRGHELVAVDHRTGVDILGDGLRDALQGCDAVVHLAGVLGTEELFAQAEHAVNVNIVGTLRVLELCREYGITYTAVSLPFVFDSVYRFTKECAFRLAMAWRQYGVAVSHVVAYNAYGPGQKVHGVQKILPTFATYSWRRAPLPVWGDGRQVMDLVYVGDVARMLVDAITYGNGEVFHAGTGVPVTVNAFARMVNDHTGSRAGTRHLPMRMGEPAGCQIVADDPDGWELLGWKPEYSLEQIWNTIDWYQKERP